MLLVGVDWAERHHDVCLVDDRGVVLAKRRISEGLGGVKVRFARLIHRTRPRSWRPSARAAFGGSLSLTWLPRKVVPNERRAAT